MKTYSTRSYDVTPNNDGTYTVVRSGGRDYQRKLSFAEACQLADLYQGDDDDERAREDWEQREYRP